MLSLLAMPSSICEELEMIMKNFLWGSTEEKYKFHLLSWDQICLELSWGGLGVKRLKYINQVLLCKWVWLLGDGIPKLWKTIIFRKYGANVGS